MSIIVCLWSRLFRFLGKQVSNMYARRVRGTSADYGTITAIAIDKDKNSQHALKWAVENIVVDTPQCVLLHVQRKHLSLFSSSSKLQRQRALIRNLFCSRKHRRTFSSGQSGRGASILSSFQRILRSKRS